METGHGKQYVKLNRTDGRLFDYGIETHSKIILKSKFYAILTLPGFSKHLCV